jgi:carbon monoxide dehydrogenase subunit G
MMRLETSVVVNRPIEEVWAFLSDPFNIPRVTRFLGVHQTSPGPPGLGTTFNGRMVIFGLEARISGAITEWDPPGAYAWSARGAGCRSISVRLILEATADGTKVVRVGQVDPRPAFKPLWWIALPFLRNTMGTSNQKFKRLLEAGQGG